MTKKIKSLKDLKKKYPLIHEEIHEQFEKFKKRIKHYELDYFVFNEDNNTFFVSLSSGILDEVSIFDMGGEILDDELAVHNVSISGNSQNNEDIHDLEAWHRSLYDDDEHDTEF